MLQGLFYEVHNFITWSRTLPAVFTTAHLAVYLESISRINSNNTIWHFAYAHGFGENFLSVFGHYKVDPKNIIEKYWIIFSFQNGKEMRNIAAELIAIRSL